MAYWKFTEAILAGTPIEVYGGGTLRRDFTFVDDVVESIVRMIDRPPSATSAAACRIYNVGNHTPVTVTVLLETLERLCGRRAIKVMKPRPAGDVEATFADVTALARDFGFEPSTPLETGLGRFVDWYRRWREAIPANAAA